MTLIASLVFVGLLLTVSKRRAQLSGRAVWILLTVTLGLACWVGIDALLSRFEASGTAMGERTTIYSDTVKLIADNPILGVGPGMFQWGFRPYQSVNTALLFDHAHNDYLQSAVEWGLPIALAFWGFVIWSLWRAVRRFVEGGDSWSRGIALGSAAAVFSILLHSLVDFNLQIPANWMIFCVILGLIWARELR